MAGFSKYVKKEFLGHRDIRSTNVYDKILEDELNDVIDKVDSISHYDISTPLFESELKKAIEAFEKIANDTNIVI